MGLQEAKVLLPRFRSLIGEMMPGALYEQRLWRVEFLFEHLQVVAPIDGQIRIALDDNGSML